MIALHIENIYKKYQGKPVVVDFSLQVAPGEVVALIGESGSGKSTILKMIAGFEKPSAGQIHLYGKTVYSNEIFVEPEQRQVAMVFPYHALFPHLSAEKNIAFALQHHNRRQKRKIVEDMLNLVGLLEFRKHKPHQLSSGQLQRISLARSLAIKPKLLLLDEPLSKLDVMLKKYMREQIKRIIQQTQTTAILVTHDKEDAFVIADKVVVIKDGVTQQIDTPQKIYTTPHNEYVAHFFGEVNFVEGKKSCNGYNTPLGMIETLPTTENCTVLIRPENVEITTENSDTIPVTIVKTVFYGAQQELTLELENGKKITVFIPQQQKIEVGEQLFCKLNAWDKIFER
ncbi:ABC transporter ATP-binding protein [Candidatus Uabimicrobium amorphum]|uniref:Iron(III) ABC transporter ATP-binding protein n=1 Tax=Uabimicrobium amorphum TaxID=2596890 RepID=A0A5S9ILS0_UABAM|nr:ABC transporter ATP-binding protein [Candidatus Uabimicrobium amorphum]BBM83867.1 iron(III) ABC transporter ATP-binding protein [Candidatus Uabimicrobium amorphum]